MDASIATWNAKAVQDTVRPISYIRWRYKGTRSGAGWGRGIGDIDGGSWIPYQEPGMVTPPFAEYTSGHSTISGAASEVFTDAANQAGWSRRYGGIHFEDGDLNGRTLGHQIGKAVWAKALTYFNGTANS